MEKIYPTCGEAPQIATYIYTKLITKKKRKRQAHFQSFLILVNVLA